MLDAPLVWSVVFGFAGGYLLARALRTDRPGVMIWVNALGLLWASLVLAVAF